MKNNLVPAALVCVSAIISGGILVGCCLGVIWHFAGQHALNASR